MRDIAAGDVETAGCGPICATIRYDAPPTTMNASEPRPDTSFDESLRPEGDPGGAPASTTPDDPLQKARAEAEEMKDSWLRARAEIENVRRQGQADVARAHKYAVEKFAEDLLAVKDALEQTVSADASVSVDTLKAGADLTLKSLNAAFAKAQIREVDPAGQKFDPHQHQAMQAVVSAEPPGTVVTVFQKGYMINDRVLRPALVTVAKAADGDETGRSG
jgi:molecular chaperone GrpE